MFWSQKATAEWTPLKNTMRVVFYMGHPFAPALEKDKEKKRLSVSLEKVNPARL